VGVGRAGAGVFAARRLISLVGRDVAEVLPRRLRAITVTRILWPMSALVSLYELAGCRRVPRFDRGRRMSLHRPP
jgi:hypothetical protein